MTITRIINFQDTDLLKIRWCVGNTCNFNCAYCTSHDGDFKYPKSLDSIVKNFNKLFSVYKSQGKTKFEIEISGGEPTLWPELHTFIKLIKENNDVSVQIITNGSRTLRWWKENIKLFDKVNFSFHHKEADINHFISVVDTVVTNNVDTTVLFLMDPFSWDECEEKISYMKRHRTKKWFIEARPIFPIEGFPVSYTDYQKKYLDKSFKSLPSFRWIIKNILKLDPFESKTVLEDGSTKRVSSGYYVTNNHTNFKGWKCNIELENIYIHWNGVIKGSCGQPLFDKDYNILSDTFVDEFNIIPMPTICERINCFCQPETHVSKSKFS